MMKFVIFLAICAYVNANCDPNSGRPDNRCPPRDEPGRDVMLPHNRYCDRFYKCSWGNAFSCRCPSGQHFSVRLNRCDWPNVAGCDGSGGGSPGQCPPTNSPPAFFPHYRYCNAFFMCNWGNKEIRWCPPGLHWNARTNQCDWPQNANCNLSGPTTTTRSTSTTRSTTTRRSVD